MFFLIKKDTNDKRDITTGAQEVESADRATARELDDYFKKGKSIEDEKKEKTSKKG